MYLFCHGLKKLNCQVCLGFFEGKAVCLFLVECWEMVSTLVEVVGVMMFAEHQWQSLFFFFLFSSFNPAAGLALEAGEEEGAAKVSASGTDGVELEMSRGEDKAGQLQEM